MPRVLFIHNGSPGRFLFLNEALAARGWERAHIGPPDATDLPGAKNLRWKYTRGTTQGVLNLAVRAEADLIRAEAAAGMALALRDEGFVPDIVIGHPGWGEMAFLKEVFPAAKQIQIGELFYRSRNTDYEFDREFATYDFSGTLRIHAKNAVLALSHTDADRIVCPTPFQASTLPEIFQSRIDIIHEGVDTTKAHRLSRFGIRLHGKLIDGTRPVFTFVNRAFEPLRGFHIFMRALPRLLEQVPDADVILVGQDRDKVYGAGPTEGGTWKSVMMAEVGDKLDMSRVHFTGKLPYGDLLKVLSLSWGHVYMTYPFVLSWSLLDAMACECVMVASDTGPVRDVVRHGENGLLFDFFDHQALADQLTAIARDPQAYSHLRKAARQTVLDEYDRETVCLPAWLRLIDDVMAS
ncbi:MAG: glycosyltransferase [Rhizobiaceae bacterium]|nr:glycosyltransferase [Rhizobiaceae bacterium]